MEMTSLLAFSMGITLLALSPGPGLAAILSRSVVSGTKSGAMVVIGLLVIDFLFLGLAILGLAAVSVLLGPMFQVVKYAAALYLIWLGVKSLRSAGKPMMISPASAATHLKDVGLGAIVTLGNPKAILFYSAFLPTFFDVSKIGVIDYLAICAVIIIVSAIVYGTYIVMADKSRSFLTSGRLQKRLNQTTGIVFIGSGAAIALR